MEGILDNRLASPRSSGRPIIPSRDYTYTRTEVTKPKPTPVALEQQPQSASKHHYSQVTPVYSSVPKHPNHQKHQPRVSVVDSIKITKKPQLDFNNKKTPADSNKIDVKHTQRIEEIEFLEANIDTIDLDIMNGNLNITQTDFIRHYFDDAPNKADSIHAIKKPAHRRKFSLKNVRPNHILRFGVVVLIVGVVTTWAYVLNDSFFASQRVNATTALSVLTPPAVDPQAYRPKNITITKLNIHAIVDTVDITASGAMGVPEDIWHAGWYVGSALPGQKGATFIDGHASSSRGALFGNLDTLVPGDLIEVERNDGRIISYSVVKTVVVNRNNVDMTSMLRPYDAQKNGLNIMSCVGQWIAAENTLENRVLVFTEQL